MKDTDAMITFLEAMWLANKGEDPSQAIEEQEKRGQQNVVRGMRLPKKANEHSVPREIYFKGITDQMSYEARREIVDHNIYEYTKEQYAQMGIGVGNDYDDLFYSVCLPVGWEIKATDHTMWNELIDNKGRKRATFFYKAAFYDRSAFINFNTRFQVSVDHNCDPSADYDIWRRADFVGVVKDGDEIIYRTECIPISKSYDEDDKITAKLSKELETFMKEHYPNYKDINAYWDLD